MSLTGPPPSPDASAVCPSAYSDLLDQGPPHPFVPLSMDEGIQKSQSLCPCSGCISTGSPSEGRFSMGFQIQGTMFILRAEESKKMRLVFGISRAALPRKRPWGETRGSSSGRCKGKYFQK